MILNCYVDDRTMKGLAKHAALLGRSIEQLAEDAISEAVVLADRALSHQAEASPQEGS